MVWPHSRRDVARYRPSCRPCRAECRPRRSHTLPLLHVLLLIMCVHECVATMYSLVQHPPQTAERASADVVAAKDAFIDDLRTQLLESMGKVRTALYKVLYAVHGLIGNVLVNSINNYCVNVPIQVPLPRGLTFNLPLKWKKRVKMPSRMSAASAVEVGGKVYIGGGNDYKVLEYTMQGGQWREIETPIISFGMAVVNDQLIIVGGTYRAWEVTDQVWVLESDSNTWTQPFPAMPTARSALSAVGYKRWVLAVGGYGNKCVEVLDTASKKWYTAASLHSTAYQPSLAVIQDTLYVVWEKSAVSVSIPMLLSDAVSRSTASDEPRFTDEWARSLPDTPTYHPAITSFHGSLLAVGARSYLSSTIAMYLPQTEQWLTVAQLPSPRINCTCVVLPETGEIMVVGGSNKHGDYIKTIDICTL